MMASLTQQSRPVGGSTCLQFPQLCPSAENWFSPPKELDGFDFHILSWTKADTRPNIDSFEDARFHKYTSLNDNILEPSTKKLPREVAHEYSLLQNKQDGKFKLRSKERQCQAASTGLEERDFVNIDSLHSLLVTCVKKNDISFGRAVHLLISSTGLDFVPELADNLINLYSLGESFGEAYQVFSKLTVQRVTAWHAMISAHARCEDNRKVLQLFFQMSHLSTTPDSFISTCVMNSCASLRALTEGEAVHNELVYYGLHLDLFVASALIDFYAKCGCITKAYHVFLMLPEKNVVVWSAMIAAFVQEGSLERSLKLFRDMKEQGVEPNEYTYSILMSGVGNAFNLAHGMCLHDEFVRTGLSLDSGMASTIVDMYSKCGCPAEAHDVFNDLSNPATVCWNALISGLTCNQLDLAALQVFDSMEIEGYSPNGSTLSCSLQACGKLNALSKGQAIHNQIIRTGLDIDDYLQSSLIDMYCKCRCLPEAQIVFDKWPSCNLVVWGALMTGYVQHGDSVLVLELFTKMKKSNIKPNGYIYSCVLQACGSLEALETGINVHKQICNSGLEICGVLGSTLIGMYVKCGKLESAWAVFEELPVQNVVCWGTMLAGYVQNGHHLDAFGLYEKMVSVGMMPDRVIYQYVLEACGFLGSSYYGKDVHSQIIENGLGLDMVVSNSLIHMYIKCNCLEEAQIIFHSSEHRNKISWDAIVNAYSLHGHFSMVWDCLKDMTEEGFLADEILFTNILVACRHSGNVNESCKVFKMMKAVYGLNPTIEHFSCFVNLLGEGGYLSEAEELLEVLPMVPDATAWLSLLSACRAHKKVKLGFRCFNEVVKLDPDTGMAYVLMSSIFSEARMWEMKHKVDQLKKQRGIWKIPGRAWIEVDKHVHEFMVGDRSHPQTQEIYATLRRLGAVLKDEGHVSQVDDVEVANEKVMPEIGTEDALFGHCEKLAIAFGLLSTPAGATVRVVKNLRVCTDCHNVSKIISRIEKRDIVINDAYHVHHFSNGECSCEKNLLSG